MYYVVVKNRLGDKMSALLTKVLEHVLSARQKHNSAIGYYVETVDSFDEVVRDAHVIVTSTDPTYLEKVFRVIDGRRITTTVYVDPADEKSLPAIKRCSDAIDVRSLFDPIIRETTKKLADGATVVETITCRYVPSPWDLSVLKENGIDLPTQGA